MNGEQHSEMAVTVSCQQAVNGILLVLLTFVGYYKYLVQCQLCVLPECLYADDDVELI